jgi:hypothetical protein
MPFPVEEDCDKVLTHVSIIFDRVLCLHEVKSGSVALDSTLSFWKEIYISRIQASLRFIIPSTALQTQLVRLMGL